MNPRYPKVALRAGHRCEYCRALEAVFSFPFEVGHVIPVSEGCADDEANRALACRSCNLRKAAHTNGTDPKAKLLFVFSTRGKTDGKSISERMPKAEKSAGSPRLAGQQLSN